MSDRRIFYRTREENAVAQLVNSLKNSAWSGGVDAHAWSSRVAELGERAISAKCYPASMLEIVERDERYAEEMGSLL